MSPLAFMTDRLARVVPLYWVITSLVFLIALTDPKILQATRASWTELCKSLAFIPYVKPNGLVEPMLFVGWTLNYEIFFYLIFALSLVFPKRGIGLVGISLILGGLVTMGMVLHPKGVFASFYTDPVVLDFVSGIFLGFLYRYIPGQAGAGRKAMVLMFVVLSLAATILLPLLEPKLSRILIYGFPASLVVFGTLVLDRWSWRIKSPTMLKLGSASYSIYLTHPFATQAAEKFFLSTHTVGLASIAAVAIALAGACVTDITVYEMLERPISRVTHRWRNVRALNFRIAASK